MIFGTKSLRGLLFGKQYRPLNSISIIKENLLSNYQYLSSQHENIKIAPVLKSNAYGHGIVYVAKILDSIGAPFFCVDSLFEAYELLKAGIKTKILIMGYVNPKNLDVKKLPFSYAVFSKDLLEGIAKYQPHAGIHIFIDSGMHREGITLEELPEFLQSVKEHKSIKVEGIMSHLACADNKTNELNTKQLSIFEQAKEIVYGEGFKPEWIHIDASSGLLNSIGYSISNMARCGISLYGISAGGFEENLRPTLQLETQIVQIKVLKKGDHVGYDGTYVASKEVKVGVLPIGYNDGVNRKLSNKGVVLIDSIECPIIGRVSMNITTVDISKIENSHVGQTVVVYSSDSKEKNSIVNTAKLCDVVPYEILVDLHASTKRIIA